MESKDFEVRVFETVNNKRIVAKVDPEAKNTWVDPCEINLVQTQNGPGLAFTPLCRFTNETRLVYSPNAIVWKSENIHERLWAEYKQALQQTRSQPGNYPVEEGEGQVIVAPPAKSIILRK